MRAWLAVGLLAIAACLPGPPRVPHDDQRAARLLANHLEEVFRDRYAPAALKAQTLGWDRTRELGILRRAIDDAPDAAAARVAFQSFFRSLNDLHTSIVLEDGPAVWLGIHLLATNGGVRVAWRDPRLAGALPLAIGDEVTSIDGVAVEEALQRTASEEGYRSTPDLERAFAEWFLTLRAASDGLSTPPPGAFAELGVRRRNGMIEMVRLPWRDLEKDGPSERCPFWPKARRSILPALGHKTWEALPSAPFDAYLFEADQRIWGFMRLHTYDLPVPAQDAAIHEIDQVVNALQEQHGAGIVLDQRGNGGGNYLLAYAMFARFLDKSLIPTNQQYLVRGDEVIGFGPREELGAVASRFEAVQSDHDAAQVFASIPVLQASFGFGPRDRVAAREAGTFFRFLADARSGLTAPHFQLAAATLPDPSRGPPFRGSLVMLVDGMALSAADFVPATLQDNRRAVIFGTTTAGAGGDQRRESADDICTPEKRKRLAMVCTPPEVAAAMTALGVRAINYTVTLGVRRDGRYLENRGVTPDIPYRVTAEDLVGDFAPMRRAVLDALERQGAP